jgi:hypothetical protein
MNLPRSNTDIGTLWAGSLGFSAGSADEGLGAVCAAIDKQRRAA